MMASGVSLNEIADDFFVVTESWVGEDWDDFLRRDIAENDELLTDLKAAGHSSEKLSLYRDVLLSCPADDLFACCEGGDKRIKAARRALRKRSEPAVVKEAIRLCRSENAHLRATGLLILMPKLHDWEDETTFDLLCSMFATETNAEVLELLVYCLYHGAQDNREQYLLPLAQHSESDIRFAVAVGLGGIAGEASIAALMKLALDPIPDIRSWSIFGLNLTLKEYLEHEKDLAAFAPVRELLAGLATDSTEDVRSEAIAGLSLLKDPRGIEPLIASLAVAEPRYSAIASAANYGDPALCEALKKIDPANLFDPEILEEALQKCGC